ncbi:nuclear transport factor 2 family protein [Pedobacter sp. KR3-3]|uniref:Nuclear transport factor 2 family protein n=1 Tax=Pedobacter albus TaxID=3113905 RepID=A0ABU7I4N2_9SPHI|nr:nuclear transport factor 2 family protein [Pedobacter sp. KR3-3]MEE1944418.1 nuclear transport factor 2 family protein [Pedobacter sp. KR3-3]
METKAIVQEFLAALNAEDFAKARTFLNDNMKFIGVMGTRDNADTYIADMEKMRFKYKIQRLFADEKGVAVFYDIDMGKQTIFSAGWYELENNQIKIFKVLFDPRPLLAHS